MLMKFWGVRGSLPSPVKADQVQAKIAAVVSRITPKDLENEETKMRFLSQLPSWIYGTVGGNTPCVELRNKNDDIFILDCGSGLRAFSQYGRKPKDKHYSIFLSHYHWDHIQGFPFFGPSFDPTSKIDIYTGHPNAEEIFAGQSTTPYFPPNACWDTIKDHINFHQMKEGEPIVINGVTVECHKMTHPGDSYAYSFIEDGKKFIYSTDVELQSSDFDKDIQRNRFYENADVMIFDTQYTNPEAIQKVNWGHSSFSSGIDFAGLWNIKNLYFFHHEPAYDDKKLDAILSAGNSYKQYKECSKVNLHISMEGQEVEI